MEVGAIIKLAQKYKYIRPEASEFFMWTNSMYFYWENLILETFHRQPKVNQGAKTLSRGPGSPGPTLVTALVEGHQLIGGRAPPL